MKNLVVIASALSILTLQSCGTFPQTADEFRKNVQQHPSLMKEEIIEVNRPFADVTRTFQKKCSECLDKTVEFTQTSMRSGMVHSHTVTIMYKPTVVVADNKAELYVQQHVPGAVSLGGKEPEGGHYILVVDAIPLNKKKTKVDFYYGTVGNELILKAIKGWATGENPGCPDLTKN